MKANNVKKDFFCLQQGGGATSNAIFDWPPEVSKIDKSKS